MTNTDSPPSNALLATTELALVAGHPEVPPEHPEVLPGSDVEQHTEHVVDGSDRASDTDRRGLSMQNVTANVLASDAEAELVRHRRQLVEQAQAGDVAHQYCCRCASCMNKSWSLK